MKKYIFFVLTNIFMVALHAQISSTSINGTWQTMAKDAELTIYNEGNVFFGKITWLKVPGKDDKNPKVELRSRDLVGTIILTNFTFNGKDRWENGKIYDPSGGKTYACTMKLKDANKLDIRGYIGISLLGRTEVWTRK
jgi:uncharacterized protein (DUF2147 family)